MDIIYEMSELYDRIAQVISRVPLPHTNETALERRLVDSISVHTQEVRVLMRYDPQMTRTQFAHYCDELSQLCNQYLKPYHVSIVAHEQAATSKTRSPSFTQHKSIFGKAPIFMIGSGKGGVGKSTVAFSLAQSFVRDKKRVAFIDADIYGPSLPVFIHEKHPHIKFPLPQFELLSLEDGYFSCSSLGFYMNADTAPIWRGPMLKKALDQLIFQHTWPECDVVIIDLPPGTGDVVLSLSQALPITNFLLVTTPHPLAIADAQRTCHMMHKLNLAMGGIISNMVAPTAMSMGWKDTHLVQTLAEKNQGTVLGEIPFSQKPIQERALWDGLRQTLSNNIGNEGGL